jgi:hypothetical protein
VQNAKGRNKEELAELIYSFQPLLQFKREKCPSDNSPKEESRAIGIEPTT